MTFKIFTTACILVALSGCASMTSDPWSKDSWTKPKTEKLTDENQRLTLSYVGRFLKDADRRRALEATLQKRARANSGALSAAAGAGMAAAIAGSPLSMQGVRVAGYTDLAITAVGFLLPDGSMDQVSGVSLPAVWNGRALETAQDAEVALREYAEAAIQRGAARIGRTATCIKGCESPDRMVFKLTRVSQAGPYVYDPDPILAFFNALLPLVPADVPAYAPRLEGTIIPKWKTPDGHTAVVSLGVPSLDDQGQFKMSKDGHYLVLKYKPLEKTHLFRDFMKALSNDGGMGYWGDADAYPHLLIYAGELYSFGPTNYDDFVDRRILTAP